LELIRGLHNLRERHRGCVATIGAFDGVHRGHQAVIGEVISRARAAGLPSTVIVFEPLPREYFAPLQAPPRLMSFREKVPVLRALGIDYLLRIQFDKRFAAVRATDFIRDVWVEGLGARHLVVGDDVHFGYGREGNIEMLREWGTRFGFSVGATSTVALQGERVSSTRLRALLSEGDFGAAERLLGRPYSMAGKVVVGKRLGATIGVPTANLELRRLRAPLAGVYAVEVRGLGPRPLPGVANVGTRPTVDDGTKANLEVHILDFGQNIYRRSIDVVFRKRIREERRFGSLDELKARIAVDIGVAREFFGI
jgi:riboflavin kinase/FMN adenylyltransferase